MLPADTFLDPPVLRQSDVPATSGPALARSDAYQALDDADVQAQFSRPTGKPHEVESWLMVEGMSCASCAQGIERRLAARPGVISIEVNAAAGRARLVWDAQTVRLLTLFADIAALDYRPFPVQQIVADLTRRDERRKALWRLFVAGFCMMQVMMYAAPAYFANAGDITPDMDRLLKWASCVLSVPVLLFAATPFFSNAWRDLRARRIGMDVPVALGIVITFVASTASLLHAGGEAYFDSLTMFVFFLLGGRYLETLARGKAAESLERLATRLPDSVERLADWPTSQVAQRVVLHQLRVGDVLRVAVGQAFAGDGVVLQGSSSVDEALLTGEGRPISKGAGEGEDNRVVAGSYNLDAPLIVRVERLGAESRFGEIVALMARAASEKPRLAALADRYAAKFLVTVLVLAAAAGIVWWFIDPARAVWVVVSVLVVTCPCALSLATPAAVLATSGLLARRGVLVSHPAALEALAAAGRVVFDKTGTLTHEQLAFTSLESLREGVDRDWILKLAAAMEAGSLHPIARALQRAVAQGSAEGFTLTGVREVRGAGVEAATGGHVYRLGSAAFAWLQWPVVQEAGDVTTFLADENGPLAILHFGEHLREDAAAAVRALRGQRVEVSVLSGDRETSVRAVAAQAGIDDARGAQTPEAKLAVVTAWQSGEGVVPRIVMVGDGINDGPVLSRADVSIVMGSGAPLSQSDADLVLLSNRLADVPFAIAAARRMTRVVKQNIAWAAGYNVVCVPLALFGLLPPWLAGLGMACSSLLVVLNALRLARPSGQPAAHTTAMES